VAAAVLQRRGLAFGVEEQHDVLAQQREGLRLAALQLRQRHHGVPELAEDGLAARPLVVGFGPCGLFAALILAQMGLRPIVLERGKPVRERTKDTWGLWRQGVLTPESNVQFGEGGAGTFSDGKLWSQISDPRHLTRKVLTEFVQAGAPEEILYVAKPHIGTFRLVSMVEKMRAQIIERSAARCASASGSRHRDRGRAGARRHLRGCGRPGARTARRPRGAGARPQRARHLCHAARARRADGGQAVFDRLSDRASAKPDRRARFGPNAGNPLLGAADYKLVHHAANGAPSTASACARAAPWWRPPPSRCAWSPTA
jgi:uncharacterized protein